MSYHMFYEQKQFSTIQNFWYFGHLFDKNYVRRQLGPVFSFKKITLHYRILISILNDTLTINT